LSESPPDEADDCFFSFLIYLGGERVGDTRVGEPARGGLDAARLDLDADESPVTPPRGKETPS